MIAPPFNVNSTNNVIKYKRSSTGDTIHTVTINPGVYNMSDLENVFQQYQGSLFVATPTDPTNSVDTNNFAQFLYI